MTPTSRRRQRGFTLIELLVVVAIVGILAAIAFALYVNVQARGRYGRATADVRAITGAVSAYAAHMGAIPTTAEGLVVLAQVSTNTQGQWAGPYLNGVPRPPTGGNPAWPAAYAYQADIAPGGAASPGQFVVCASGDGYVVHSAAGTTTCP
ncbi:MAG TPA: prepilin-type N-terminal cleavage/methylation domain-containing protein [Methylomirabilota bacterium]|nr:prepilin-type N-terminal cleavage/methylation domain-containing protein [Methylomirabilota bacterium]